MSEYNATICWLRGDQDFLANKYSRAHEWQFDGGSVVKASASPHIVPEPWSVLENVDPEEAFVASLASCHMLFFLAFAAKQGFQVDSYTDTAVGELAKDGDSRHAMTVVRLRPEVVFAGDKAPDAGTLQSIHQVAHEHCFIANSVKTQVLIET